MFEEEEDRMRRRAKQSYETDENNLRLTTQPQKAIYRAVGIIYSKYSEILFLRSFWHNLRHENENYTVNQLTITDRNFKEAQTGQNHIANTTLDPADHAS
ncbi:uncharacterized protein EAE97_001174 [Botrytis byssoidea]|uniref:Uncharacterized protein n=1 Tax=Botrytis byssoidea TaxID=139641 RepID=A0A9P5IZH6_9HELO|nr:uncharacterized protein EAE97_001174 [Botrytis byssoidea]KAF7953775.1 hypothetical protein EAE97_001174 [Botrytis byssoidea]